MVFIFIFHTAHRLPYLPFWYFHFGHLRRTIFYQMYPNLFYQTPTGQFLQSASNKCNSPPPSPAYLSLLYASPNTLASIGDMEWNNLRIVWLGFWNRKEEGMIHFNANSTAILTRRNVQSSYKRVSRHVRMEEKVKTSRIEDAHTTVSHYASGQIAQ